MTNKSPYHVIDNRVIVTINDFIVRDEGGFILTSDPDGGDGGWTYAGITAHTWNSYFENVTPASREVIQLALKSGVEDVNKAVVEIYYNNYLVPAATHVGCSTDDITPHEFSCIVNCGEEGFKQIYNGVKNDDNVVEFCNEWLHHYVDICKDNPVKLQFLNGWVNRVFRYISDK